jgi:hypothetical protein
MRAPFVTSPVTVTAFERERVTVTRTCGSMALPARPASTSRSISAGVLPDHIEAPGIGNGDRAVLRHHLVGDDAHCVSRH